eukprot:3319156-Amphidinium_carterae.1
MPLEPEVALPDETPPQSYIGTKCARTLHRKAIVFAGSNKLMTKPERQQGPRKERRSNTNSRERCNTAMETLTVKTSDKCTKGYRTSS